MNTTIWINNLSRRIKIMLRIINAIKKNIPPSEIPTIISPPQILQVRKTKEAFPGQTLQKAPQIMQVRQTKAAFRGKTLP